MRALHRRYKQNASPTGSAAIKLEPMYTQEEPGNNFQQRTFSINFQDQRYAKIWDSDNKKNEYKPTAAYALVGIS
jgi:hypothetical protein